MYYTFRDSLVNAASLPFNYIKNGFKTPFPPKTDFWALKNINFKIKQGEAVGIIGRNGAGKSTLLKILSRICDPTDGQIVMRGRVASLLEVGTGFHPELTGRENIYLNGAVLGMNKREIDKKFDEIVEFAEVTNFLDTPIKRYSSGMYTRLAFAVAAHLEPEILVVDEVLAVGDSGFQKKCLTKMNNVALEGRTVIFVSHQLEFLAQLCPRCILLENGEIKKDGDTREVINEYLSFLQKFTPEKLALRTDRTGLGRLRFTETWMEDINGARIRRATSGQTIKLVATYEIKPGEQLGNMVIGFAVLSIKGIPIVDFGTDIFMPPEFSKTLPQKGKVECIIPHLPINSGEFVYNLIARSAHSGHEIEDWIKQAGIFSVEPGNFYENDHLAGPANLVCINHSWKLHAL